MANYEPLARVKDICDREGIVESSLSETQRTRLEALLKDASAFIRRETKQIFSMETSTIVLQGRNHFLTDLPQRPVIEIISINENPYTGSVLDFGKGLANTSQVTYVHGYDEIPDEIVALVCGLVQRTMSIHKAAKSGITTQSVGPYSISFAGWATGGNITLSPDEKRICRRYRIPTAGYVTAGRR